MANVTGWYAEVSASIAVPRMTATAVMNEPDLAVNSAITLKPPRMAATGVLKTPSLGLSTILTIPRMSATATMSVPAVSNAYNVSVTAPRMTSAAVMAVPGVNVSADIAPPRMAATAAMTVPVVANNSGANYSDTFNRTNSASLGASWNTEVNFGTSITIASNAAVSNTYAANIYTLPMSTGNNQVTVVMKGTPAASDAIFIYTRSDNATDVLGSTTAVSANITQGQTWALYRYAADGTGVSTAGTQSWADGDTITFSTVGSTLTIKKNGSTILTTGGATDLAAGYVALAIFSGSGGSFGFDSFTAQDI